MAAVTESTPSTVVGIVDTANSACYSPFVAVFEITSSRGDVAYADTPDQAYLAYVTLLREAGLQGSTARIVNLETGQLVHEGSKT